MTVHCQLFSLTVQPLVEVIESERVREFLRASFRGHRPHCQRRSHLSRRSLDPCFCLLALHCQFHIPSLHQTSVRPVDRRHCSIGICCIGISRPYFCIYARSRRGRHCSSCTPPLRSGCCISDIQ